MSGVRRTLRSLVVAITTTLVLSTVMATPGHADPPTGADPAVITRWQAIATRTIIAENATPSAATSLYYGFVAVAMYDSVVAIEGGFTPYLRQPRAHHRAYPQVAAATAAYRVLKHYFPASAANLDADYAAALAGVPDGVGLVQGKRVGEAAANAVIQARQDDGRDAVKPLTVESAPGVWRPTPDGFLPMLVPWLGFVRPLALRSPTQLRWRGPDPLDSARYARDFAEAKAYGAKDNSLRTPWQTETALFWNAPSVPQYQVALVDQLNRRGLDIVHSSRAYALLTTATADALITCWRAKYDTAFWRPSTAIQLADTDGNAATEADPAWLPLVQNPNYPDYVSGHACVSGAATNTFAHLFGAGSIDLNVSSSVTGTTRHYDTTDQLDTETMNARIWLGVHFRTAMTDGNRLGHQASRWTIATQFRPVRN